MRYYSEFCASQNLSSSKRSEAKRNRMENKQRRKCILDYISDDFNRKKIHSTVFDVFLNFLIGKSTICIERKKNMVEQQRANVECDITFVQDKETDTEEIQQNFVKSFVSCHKKEKR